jgi:hypothetical protein
MRILAILSFLEAESSANPDRETFEYPFTEWSKHNHLFTDRTGVERALDQIKKDSEDRISAKIVEREFLYDEPVMSAAVATQKVLKKATWVEFFVEAKNAVQECLSLTKAKLANKKYEVGFVVTFEGKQCVIRLAKSSNTQSVTLKQSGRPCKILNHLRKQPMTTAELADTFEVNTKAVSDAISGVREKIKERFGVDGKLFFENIGDRHFLKRSVFPK